MSVASGNILRISFSKPGSPVEPPVIKIVSISPGWRPACITVRIAASHYWPHNALNAGQALFLLMPGLPHFPSQSILGLPLFAGRYAVFDRRAGGTGTVRLAQARLP